MLWEDLTKDNIEEVKELYREYIEESKDSSYVSNLLSFEQFMLTQLDKCSRCGKIENKEFLIRGNNDYEDLCECCNDDLHEIPYNEPDEEPNYDGHDEWLDHQNGII